MNDGKFGKNNVKAIRGTWWHGDNLATFNKLVQSGISPEEAAKSTFTGKMAGEYGFNNVDFIRVNFQNGEYVEVEVVFY